MARNGIQWPPSAEGWLDKKGEEDTVQIKERIKIHLTCKYNKLDNQIKSTAACGPVDRPVYNYGVGNTCRGTQRKAEEGREKHKKLQNKMH